MDVLKHAAQLLSKLLFFHAWQRTFATVASATVIGVFLLFEFSRHHAIVVSTGQKTAKGKLMFLVFGFVMSVEDGLHLPEDLRTDDGRVTALVLLSIPGEEAQVKLIPQNALVNMAFDDVLSCFRANDPPQLIQGAIAGRIQVKHAPNYFGILRVNFNRVLDFVIAIPKGRASWIDALCGFFVHALFNFLAQVLNVITSDKKLEAMHQFRL